jgi:hypothetical protein
VSAQVLTLSAVLRPVTRRHGAACASVTVLAEHRRAAVAVTLDPLVFARSWLDFWAGARK